MAKGKLLLTSSGITNASIQKALVDIHGKPIEASTALFAPTAIYDEFGEEMPSNAGSAKTLALVNFVIRPHFKADYFPQTTVENVEKWAARVDTPLYALDDQSAVKVVDEKVEVVSSGEWQLF